MITLLELKKPIPAIAFGLSGHTPRPALMATRCEGWHRNPAYYPDCTEPALIQCERWATRRVILDDGIDCYTKKLCPRCAALQRREANKNGVEIISDEPIGEE